MGSAIPGRSLGWVTIIDLDVTAENTLDYQTGGDGAKALGAISVHAENVASCTSFGITNGTGLVMDADSTSTAKHFNARTAPQISGKFATLDTSFDPYKDTARIWCRTTWANMGANYEGWSFGLEDYQAAASAATIIQEKRSYHSGQGNQTREIDWGSSSSYVLNEATDLTHDIHVVEYDPRTQICRFASALWAGSWPADSGLTWRHTKRLQDSLVWVKTLPNIAFFWASDTSNTDGSFTATLTNLKLEWKKF